MTLVGSGSVVTWAIGCHCRRHASTRPRQPVPTARDVSIIDQAQDDS